MSDCRTSPRFKWQQSAANARICLLENRLAKVEWTSCERCRKARSGCPGSICKGHCRRLTFEKGGQEERTCTRRLFMAIVVYAVHNTLPVGNDEQSIY
jgi:hypothetical protein